MPLSSPLPDDALLLIRCPSCGQRFKVGDDLRGRTVECGGCEHRFRIQDDVIVRGRKFYPGERKDPTLNRFQRVSMARSAEAASIETARYADAPDPSEFEPTPPLRLIAGFAAVLLVVIIALFLFLGSSKGGALEGMSMTNRGIMAGFTGLVATALLVYANRHGRAMSVLIGLLVTAGLIVGQMWIPGEKPTARKDTPPPAPVETPVEQPKPTDGIDPAVLAEIGIGPLEKEIARLQTEGGSRQAVGLWLRGLREQYRLTVRDYLLRTLKADPQSHYYPRGNGDFLMVVTGIEKSLDQIVPLVSAFGSIERTFPSIQVIEVRIENSKFAEPPMNDLTDKSKPVFYDLNKLELHSIEPERVAKAVRRLAEAEPKVFRADINQRLLALLREDWVDFKNDVCRALVVWSGEPGPAGEAAVAALQAMPPHEREKSAEIAALAVREKNPDVIPILDELWNLDPVKWESLYSQAGPAAEEPVLARFNNSEGPHRHSATRVLAKVGTAKSIPALDAAYASADPELKVLIEQAKIAIGNR